MSREDKPREYILRFAKTLRESGNEFAAEGIENAVAELTRSSCALRKDVRDLVDAIVIAHEKHTAEMMNWDEWDAISLALHALPESHVSAVPECSPTNAAAESASSAISAGATVHSAAAPLSASTDIPRDDEIRLAMGELTADQMRTAKAAIRWILARSASPHPKA